MRGLAAEVAVRVSSSKADRSLCLWEEMASLFTPWLVNTKMALDGAGVDDVGG
jgi:hypothetical protein